MIFDEIVSDPATVLTPSSSRLLHFWRDIQYIPTDLLLSLEFHYSSSFMTEIQHDIFESCGIHSRKIHSIISNPNTGTTLALVILSIIASTDYSQGIKVLWISSCSYNMLNVKKIFTQLRPSLRCTAEITNTPPDVFLMSLNKDNCIRRSEPTIYHNAPHIKVIVLDGAEEILETKSGREWVGEMICNIYRAQTGSQPSVFLTQYHNNNHVSTFVKELNSHIEGFFKICTNPETIISRLDTFRMVPQYYATILGESNWVARILGNAKKPVRRGVLIFGECDLGVIRMLKCTDINGTAEDPAINKSLESLRTAEVKIGICRGLLHKKIKSLGVGCVVHMGFPMAGTDIDFAEYRSRVQRAYTPTFIGFSLVLIKQEHIHWVSSCSTKLNIQIEKLPI